MSHVHDGQGDAMPCTCPACASPFIAPRRAAPVNRAAPAHPDFADLVDNIAAAKLCRHWCGDACTCGRGPESGDLDALDIEGMRAIEGRT